MITLRYMCVTRWLELVPVPKWLDRFWFTQMLWNVLVHRKCSLVTYHNATSELQAKLMAIEFCTEHMPGPQHLHRCRVRSL